MKEYEDPKYLLGVIAQQNQVLEQVIAERDDLGCIWRTWRQARPMRWLVSGAFTTIPR